MGRYGTCILKWRRIRIRIGGFAGVLGILMKFYGSWKPRIFWTHGSEGFAAEDGLSERLLDLTEALIGRLIVS